jgi:hypothetical protein
MAEEVFGLTAQAEKYLRQMMADWQRAHPQADRRTRRIYPTSSNNRLVLIKYTDTSAALGPRDSGGIQYEGDCEIYDHLVTGASTPSPIPTGTASGQYCMGVLLPGQTAWARFANGIYWVQSASHYLEGVAAEDIGDSGGNVNVGEGDDGVTAVEIDCLNRCGKLILAGTHVGIGVRPDIGGDPNGCQCRIIWECCPDIDGD